MDRMLDFETWSLNTQGFYEYLSKRRETDVWLEPYINEVSAIGIENLPLLFPETCQNIKVKRGLYTIDVQNIDYKREPEQECIDSTGLFLVTEMDGKVVPLPTREIALYSILQRGEDYCGTMSRYEQKPNKSVLPVSEKAQRLARDFQLYSDRCKILYRDGKVSAMLSKDYVILHCADLIQSLEGVLKREHPDMALSEAEATHEFVVAEYNLNNTLMEESLKIKLNDVGCDINSLTAGVRFSSSDVGLSSVQANLYVKIDGNKVYFDGIKMPHKGEASLELFQDKLSGFGDSLKEAEERIEELGNTDIADVSKVVSVIVTGYPQIFSKKIADDVIEEAKLRFPNGGTGIDVYLLLCEIINRFTESKEVNTARYLAMTEQVTKLLRLPFDRIDATGKL